MERPHTGRRRNEAAREAIIDAAIALLQQVGYEGFTIERLARDAEVGKQTIYRWWPSKAAVIAEAVGTRARHTIPLPDTGALGADLREFFETTFQQSDDPNVTNELKSMMAASIENPEAARPFYDFLAGRRATLRLLLERGAARAEVSPDADLDFLTDLAYGLLWYRGLIGHRPLDDEAARKLAGALVAAAANPQ
ncbi:TetR/AcrR family transcriptional regulator [Catenulispora sp. NF23]|uniref:TetR/AcrR family transcriptional regulator n=1 Tax=Catenulispora pinistramenti TaxID=2705254 RepID=UPI001BABCF51|nr:TetR/AcrR family transcriptional regulator [Catenulispora pinistramenti]MBS2531331.1 TetR/AcrR family transcriptional regulator [Catenulispora pinistramenti]